MVLIALTALLARAEAPLPLPEPDPGPTPLAPPPPDTTGVHLAASLGVVALALGPEQGGAGASTARIELGGGRERVRVFGVAELKMLNIAPWYVTNAHLTGGLLGDSILFQVGPGARYLFLADKVWFGARVEGGLAVTATPMEPSYLTDEIGLPAGEGALNRFGLWAGAGADLGYPVLGGALVIEGSVDVRYIGGLGVQLQPRAGVTARL